MRARYFCVLGTAVALVVAHVMACGGSGTSPCGIAGIAPADGGSSGTCGARGSKAGFAGSQSLAVGGDKTRTYELFVPETREGSSSFPLILVFHGDGGTGASIRQVFGLENTSGGGAVIAYPDGENQTWQIDGADGLLRDVGFVDAIVSELKSTGLVDPKRVFAVGFSRGAYFANQVACFSKSSFRAVVTHAGGGPFFVEGTGATWSDGHMVCPAAPVAALQVQGESDGVVAVSEGIKPRDHWRAVNRCEATSSPYSPEPCIAFDGCAAGLPEVYCQVPGMGHTVWPEYGARVTWDFLKTK